MFYSIQYTIYLDFIIDIFLSLYLYFKETLYLFNISYYFKKILINKFFINCKILESNLNFNTKYKQKITRF